MFIYLITNLINGKYYVGQHKHADLSKYISGCFKRALHSKDEKPLLYRAVRKYGAEHFTAEVLATAQAKEQLSNLERLWIAALDSRNPSAGYNIAHGGQSGYGKGLPEHYRTEHARRMTGANNLCFGKPFPAAEGSGTAAAIKWMKEHREEHRTNCVKASTKSWEGLTPEERDARIAPARAARWAAGVTHHWDSDRKIVDVSGSKNPFFGRKHKPESIAKANAARAARRAAKKEATLELAYTHVQ